GRRRKQDVDIDQPLRDRRGRSRFRAVAKLVAVAQWTCGNGSEAGQDPCECGPGCHGNGWQRVRAAESVRGGAGLRQGDSSEGRRGTNGVASRPRKRAGASPMSPKRRTRPALPPRAPRTARSAPRMSRKWPASAATSRIDSTTRAPLSNRTEKVTSRPVAEYR